MTRRSETESSLYCESAKEVLSEKKVTETATSETAKIIHEKEIALNKILEHMLIIMIYILFTKYWNKVLNFQNLRHKSLARFVKRVTRTGLQCKFVYPLTLDPYNFMLVK